MALEWLRPRMTSLLPAAVAAAGVIALRGLAWPAFGAAACLFAAAALWGSGSWAAIPAGFLAMAGALLVQGPQAAALLMVSGLLSSVSGRAFPDRSLGLLGALLVAQAGDLSGTWPVLAASIPVMLVDRTALRTALAAICMPASILLWGFPAPSSPPEVVIQEFFSESGESWPDIEHLDQSSPSALMRVDADATGPVALVLDAGGVRDSLPMGYVAAGGLFVPVFPGRDTLRLDCPGSLVEIRLVRPPAAFQHPVIHIGPSRVAPETLDD